MKRLLVLLLPLALAACTFVLTACAADRAALSPVVQSIEGVAPPLAGVTLDGAGLDPADHRGRVMVVNLWATWCGPCEREQPILAVVARAQGSDGAFFLGVDERDDPGAARAWVERFDVPYPNLPDPRGYLAYRFGAPYLPVTIVIDAEGRLRYRVVGQIDRATLERLIRQAGSSSD